MSIEIFLPARHHPLGKNATQPIEPRYGHPARPVGRTVYLDKLQQPDATTPVGPLR